MYSILVGGALLVLLTVLLRSIYARKIQYRSLSKISGPPSNYIWGNLFDLNKDIKDSFGELIKLNKHYGRIVTLWPCPWKPLVIVAHSKFIERILSTNKHLGKSSLYEYLKPFIGESLPVVNVENWKRQRKIVNPAFQPKIFDTYMPIFDYHGNKCIDILKKEQEGSIIDLPHFIDLFILDTICELITNVRTNFQETSDKGYLNARSTYLTIFMNRAYSSLKRSELYFSHTHEYKIYKKCIDILKKFPLPIIEAAKTARKKKNIFDGENESSRKVVDFFLDSDISENEFRDNIDMFIVAGHDTPGSGIAFTLYELAQNSVVQNKLLDESISLLGKDPDAVVTLQDIQNMTYLDCVLKETLRKYPSVPSYERTLEEDITIDGITIPRGTEVAISAYAIHHDEDYFPKPDVYDPDRFLLENSDKIQPYSYIPFSKGPRDCIGKTIAMLVMKSIITKILRNFELLPANTTHTPELTCEFVLKSANGLPVKILRRSL